MFYFDAHNHLCHFSYPAIEEFAIKGDEYFCIANFCSDIEWIEFQYHEKANVLKSFGLHPQMFTSSEFSDFDYERNIFFLENLLKDENKNIFAVGEIGFDFFTDEFKATKEIQKKFWNIQLEFAIRYQKPIIVHCRKAMEMIFLGSKRLKKLPAVIFHSFSGTCMDANSILKRGVNAFFSFGKHQIMNGKKASIEMLKNYSDFEDRIFLETDAPYQTLKNEKVTEIVDIRLVYEKCNSFFGVDFSEITRRAFDRLINCV